MGKSYRTQILDAKVVKVKEKIGKPKHRWVKNKELYEKSMV